MASFAKQTLSASTNGKAIPITALSGTGTLIHTAMSTAGQLDEIWLYATNIDTTDRKLSLQFGSTNNGDLIELTIPAEFGLILIVPGLVLGGAAGLGGTS